LTNTKKTDTPLRLY